MYTDENPPSLLNPELVVEVLSDTTMQRDLTWKLNAYREIESVREVCIVWTEQVRLDQYARVQGDEDGRSENGNEWRLRSLERKDAVLRSKAFDLELSVAVLYELVL